MRNKERRKKKLIMRYKETKNQGWKKSRWIKNMEIKKRRRWKIDYGQKKKKDKWEQLSRWEFS